MLAVGALLGWLAAAGLLNFTRRANAASEAASSGLVVAQDDAKPASKND